jgi:hypothetical protein
MSFIIEKKPIKFLFVVYAHVRVDIMKSGLYLCRFTDFKIINQNTMYSLKGQTISIFFPTVSIFSKLFRDLKFIKVSLSNKPSVTQ